MFRQDSGNVTRHRIRAPGAHFPVDSRELVLGQADSDFRPGHTIIIPLVSRRHNLVPLQPRAAMPPRQGVAPVEAEAAGINPRNADYIAMWLINATPFAGSVLRRCGPGCLGMVQIRGARSFVTSNRLAGASRETLRDHCVFRGPGDRNCLATVFYILAGC